MKLWRVLMSVHMVDGSWKSTVHLPCFYVHAVDGPGAQLLAESTALAVKSALTSGSAILVDANLDPIADTYHSWSDLPG